MKNYYITGTMILFLILVVNFSDFYAQEKISEFFIETQFSEMTKSSFAEKYSIEANSIQEFYPIKVNIGLASIKDHMPFKIGNDIMMINKDRIITRGQNSFSLIGSVEGKKINNAVITVRNDFIAGIIYMDSVVYNIVTFKDMEYYLLREDNTNNYSCGTSDEQLTIYGEESHSHEQKSSLWNNAMSKNENIIESANSTNSCNMRIIVLYTPAAKAFFTDIMTSIQNAIDASNHYLQNSLVNETWELAFTGLTNYTEHYIDPGDGRFTDLNRFRNDGDGYMDEVHDLREKYSADICVLLSKCQYTTKCGGVASAIDASTPDKAFCLVHAQSWGGVPSKTFAHEIGHLLGGLHQDSGGTTPYAFGHGYHNSEQNFQTIMGNLWGPTLTPNFSNPDVYFQNYVTGTTNWNDCGRVMELEIPKKARFLQPETIVAVTVSDVVGMAFGEVIAEQTTTLLGITIPTGAVLKVRSDETIINNGFTVELGAELEVINESVYSCP